MFHFCFKIAYVLGCFILLVSEFQEVISLQGKGKDKTNQNQCGGPLEADIGSLTYPMPSQVARPGELCVWTVNLQTTKAFTFNFTNLNINSSSECTEGSVRIYSLTNLVATDKLESYTLCNENPTPGNLFLMENVAAVVFYSGSNPGPETGFTINWEGIAFNPIPSQHFNSYSTTPSGLIRFPVEGEYEPNTIATWLVKAGQIDEEINLDFNLTSLSLDTCMNTDNPCVCDALILYEITNQGVLTESERFCGERASAVKGKISSNFILAFFADFHLANNTANGFEVIYKPAVSQVTTTERPSPNVPCGTIIDAVIDDQWNPVQGQLAYKPGVAFEANERCVWTIRTSPSHHVSQTKMEIRLEEAGFGNSGDRVTVDLFDYGANNTSVYYDPHVGTLQLTQDRIGVTYVNTGTVAIITFRTVGSTGRGFILSYKITDMECHDGVCLNNVFTDMIVAQPQGLIVQSNETMGNNMMSTFVLPPPNFLFNATTRKIQFEYSYMDCCCADAMWAYYFTDSGLVLVNEICGSRGDTDEDLIEFVSDDIVVFVFRSDNNEISSGFEIRW